MGVSIEYQPCLSAAAGLMSYHQLLSCDACIQCVFINLLLQ